MKLNFGKAVEALKSGGSVARSGWNGKGMYLLLVASGDYGINADKQGLWTDLRENQKDSNEHVLLPWIGMRTADGKFVPWLASQTDVLADDWEILSGETQDFPQSKITRLVTMEYLPSVNLVKEFHEVFGHPIADSPSIPPEGVNKFRAEFIEEEARETKTACDEGNLIEVADGLGDMTYVIDGWFLNTGLWKFKDRIMAEIHRSNMTKACQTEQQAIDTVEFINSRDLEGEDHVNYRKEGDLFVIFRIRDGKIGKSIYYEKPDLSFINE